MKSIRSSMRFKMLSFALAVGALSASVGNANAQSAKGKFTLTHEARWGSVLLTPGVYTFSLKSPSLPAPLMVGKAGSAQVAIVLPEVVTVEKMKEGSQLVLTRNDAGESFVSALYLGDIGLSLHYAAPKLEAAKLSPIADSQLGK